MSPKLPTVQAWRRAVVLASLLVLGWPSATLGQSPRSTPLASAEDYLFVCRTDAGVHRCVEVISSNDLRGASAPAARLNYFEIDTVASDGRGLSCVVAPSSLSLRSTGKRLRDASLRVAVHPASQECVGSWGLWAAGPVAFALDMTESGGFVQQSKGHGYVRVDGSEFRYVESLESWSVEATGTVDGHDFDGATGNIQTLRRTNITKTR